MGGPTILALAVTAVLVLALVGYLTSIAYMLYQTSFTLGTVLIGVRAIENQTEPVPKYVASILNDVLAIDQAAKQLLSWGEESYEPPPRRAPLGVIGAPLVGTPDES